MTTDFESRVSRMIGDGALCLSLAVGHRLRLFDELEKASKESGVDSAGLAASLGLKERYVREWLGAVVTGDVVELAESEGKYYLPKEKAKCLSFGHGDPTGMMTWSLPILASAYEDIVSAFRKDGPLGVPYSRYPLFHEWLSHTNEPSYPNFIDELLTTSDVALWSKASTPPGLDVCELGCSHGALSRLLAEKFPESRFWASDIAKEAIDRANERKKAGNLPNLTYEVRDAAKLPVEWTEKFDVVVIFDVVHDLPRPDLVVKEVYRVVKEGGVAFIVDINLNSRIDDNIGDSTAPFVYTFSLFHCMPVSLDCGPEAWGLGAAWGRQRAKQLFQEAGFEEPQIIEGTKGMEQHCMYVCRK